MKILGMAQIVTLLATPLTHTRASDFFQDRWAKVTYGAKNGGSFTEMMGPSMSNKPQLTFG